MQDWKDVLKVATTLLLCTSFVLGAVFFINWIMTPPEDPIYTMYANCLMRDKPFIYWTTPTAACKKLLKNCQLVTTTGIVNCTLPSIQLGG